MMKKNDFKSILECVTRKRLKHTVLCSNCTISSGVIVSVAKSMWQGGSSIGLTKHELLSFCSDFGQNH